MRASAKRLSGSSELAQAGFVHAQEDPVIEGTGAESAVEAEGVFIPVKRGPLEAGAVALNADARDGVDESTANAFAARGRAHINVVKPKTASTDEAGEGEEIDGVADGFTVNEGEKRASGRLRAKERIVERFGRGDEVVLEAFEASEFADEFEQDGNLRGRQRLNRPHDANFPERMASIQLYNQPRAAIANCGATS